jgi:ATP synthase protein I
MTGEQKGGGPDPLPGAKADADDGASIGSYAGLGLQFAVTLVAFLYGGMWLDRKVGSAPLFLILGVFVGAAASIYAMYRKLMSDQRRQDDRAKGGKR